MWFLLLFSLLFTHPVYAQESTISAQPLDQQVPNATSIAAPNLDPKVLLFEQYKRDYLFQFDLYQKAYIDYTNKKQTHTKYGTLTTQQEKMDATKNVLTIRNMMYKTYLMALRTDLEKYKTVDPTETEKNQIKLSKWEDWFQEQNQIIPSFNNDVDIAKWIAEFKKQYVQIQKDTYTALAQHEINFRNQILNDTKTLANEIQTSPKLPIDSLQWFTNLPIKSDLVTNSLRAAFLTTQRTQSSSKFNNFYPNTKLELTKATGYLADIVKDLKSIVLKFEQ